MINEPNQNHRVYQFIIGNQVLTTATLLKHIVLFHPHPPSPPFQEIFLFSKKLSLHTPLEIPLSFILSLKTLASEILLPLRHTNDIQRGDG